MWVRQIEELDITKIVEIEKDCFSDPWSKTLLQEMYKSKYDRTWVLEDNHIIIGYINIRILGDEAELMRITIIPKRRGEKLSRILVEKMDTYLEDQGVNAVTLEVRQHNIAAVKLYLQSGFKTEGIRTMYYHKPDDDALIMWRREKKC